MTTTAKDYIADSAPEWRYPLLDGEPPRGKKLNLLTSGGIAVIGQWAENSNYIAWAPLLKASKIKEHMLKLIENFTGSVERKALLIEIFRQHSLIPKPAIFKLFDVVTAFLQHYPQPTLFTLKHFSGYYEMGACVHLNVGSRSLLFVYYEDFVTVGTWLENGHLFFKIPHHLTFDPVRLCQIIAVALSAKAMEDPVCYGDFELRGSNLVSINSERAVCTVCVDSDIASVLRLHDLAESMGTVTK